MTGDTGPQALLRQRLTTEWPDYGTTDGFVIPPVRPNGRTARLIDLAVKLAEEIYSQEIDDIIQLYEPRRQED